VNIKYELKDLATGEVAELNALSGTLGPDASRMMRDRDAWLKPHQRSAILQRTAGLLEAQQTH
jgi:hypothetical protein